MADQAPADDAHLPDTGVGLALERSLSPAFIVGERYGTRATTWLEWDAEAGIMALGERRFGPGGAALGESLQRVGVVPAPMLGAAVTLAVQRRKLSGYKGWMTKA